MLASLPHMVGMTYLRGVDAAEAAHGAKHGEKRQAQHRVRGKDDRFERRHDDGRQQKVRDVPRDPRHAACADAGLRRLDGEATLDFLTVVHWHAVLKLLVSDDDEGAAAEDHSSLGGDGTGAEATMRDGVMHEAI